METAILACVLVALAILVYISYNSVKKVEKEKQEELDKEMAADWDLIDAEMNKED